MEGKETAEREVQVCRVLVAHVTAVQVVVSQMYGCEFNPLAH